MFIMERPTDAPGIRATGIGTWDSPRNAPNVKPGVSRAVLDAVERSPDGIARLDVLESLGLCDRLTLRTTLSRLNKSGRIIRLKRGVYSANPMKDIYVCAQSTFNGYLGFSTALHLHGLIAEMPFTITVVTVNGSGTKKMGEYEFMAVSLKEKAIGFERKGDYVVSTRAKTLFDCLYLPRYSVESRKLSEAFAQADLPGREWKEFRRYVKKFAAGKAAESMLDVERAIRGDVS